jgi:hypothetical protein
MVSAQRLLRFIDLGGEVRRPPLVGMKFLHQRRVVTRISPASYEARGLIGRFVDQFVRSHQTIPRCSISLYVLTPSGLLAVKVRCGKTATVGL